MKRWEKRIHSQLQKISEINQTVKVSRGNTERLRRVYKPSPNCYTSSREAAEVVEVIIAKQRQVEGRASGVIMELEQEIDELMHGSTELEQLSQAEDDIYLL